MNILKFIVLVFLLVILYYVISYSVSHSKKCNTIYIPLIDKYKDSENPNKFFKGYEKDDNISFLKYKIK